MTCMKKLIAIAACVIFLVACENRKNNDGISRAPENEDVERTTDDRDKDRTSPITNDRDKDLDRDRDNDRGLLEGDRSEEKIDRSVAMAGRSIFLSECASCHRVVDKDETPGIDKKLAGPELTEITDRRNDRWLVRFMTNTEGKTYANKDPEDICNVQKKGKELNRDQALKVLEYLHMRNAADDQR